MPRPGPDISIVTPTYDRRASLVRLLDALRRQTYPAVRFEVVVVDDGSSDGTPDAVRALSTPYRLTLLEQRHNGPAGARNLGVRRAAADLILFLDDDVLPSADLIERHVAAHAGGPRTVVVGPMDPPRRRRPAWIRWEEAKLERQYRAMLAGAYPCTPRQFYTANASVERDEILAAGGFDDRFARAEDVELAYRLLARGARFVFDPSARVLHYASRSLTSWRRACYLYGRADVAMDREKGHGTWPAHLAEFHGRHPLNKLVTRATVGHPRSSCATRAALVAATHLLGIVRLDALASWSLSALANLLYWQGAADELGGAARLWALVDAAAPVSRAAVTEPE